ncbi:metallophosphoesterase [Cecembia rubra]|uniref:Serine/threonine protein phosphatase 1 n=1 Tax=Cecembia rubra TaxID=1485585 RepID=A0A2P8EAC3_9BACT|nr:metallophosphoesterase [Cecembia rubra]PSL06422.1 serine/threonine protein phosphatase 1 [Cecembia rubra]
MDLFIIGDVHGCFFTYLKLLEHWNPKTENLIQVGDLVDRGNFPHLTVRLSYEIQLAFKKQTVFLKGNHEQMMVDFLLKRDNAGVWEFNGGIDTLNKFELAGIDPLKYMIWLRDLPLYWENKHVFISHAGVSDYAQYPFNPLDPNGLLWNRKPLKNIQKIQVIGHTPRLEGKPEYQSQSNSWNIDTGAYGGICLTGIKLKKDGNFKEIISIPTDYRDIEKTAG